MNSSPQPRRSARLRAADAASMLVMQWWGFVLAAGIVAAGFANVVYDRLDLPQRYNEWVVGSIGWSYEDKFHDYAVLVGFVLAFILSLGIVLSLASRLKTEYGVGGVQRLHDSMLLLCAPAGLWLGGLLTTKSASLALLNASQALLVAFAFLVAFSIRRGGAFWRHDPATLFWAMHCALLAAAVAVFAACAIGVAVNRIGALVHAHDWLGARAITIGALLGAATVLGLVLLLLVAARNVDELTLRLKQLTIGLQAFLPLLLLCLVPPAWILADGALSSGYRLSAFGHGFVLAATAWAAFNLFRLMRRSQDEDARGAPPSELISLGSAIAVLLFLKMAPVGLPIIDTDDYHFGEMLVPWWSWADKGMIPFWDYAPARGLLNYVPGALSSAMFDGTPGAIRATYAFLFVMLAPLTLIALRVHIGMGLAFLAILLGPMANGVGEIDLVTTAFIASMCWGYFRWSAYAWLATYVALGTALLLYAPGQGALSLIACSPVALLQVWRQWSTAPGALLRLALVVAAMGALFAALTPLGRMLLGAIRYGAEQSSINSIAHGVNWNLSFGSADVNPWLFEAMRAAWLGVAAWAAALFCKAAFAMRGPGRTRTLVFASVIFLVLMLFIVRTAGRIDIGASRLGLASSWALALLAPLLLSLVTSIRGVHVLAWVTAAGMVTPYFGGIALPTLAQNVTPFPVGAFDGQAAVRVQGDAILGSDIVDKAQLARITTTRQVLAAVLEPQETYLDLTGRHAMYFYVGRQPPIETGAMYNLVGEAQQLRAIAAVRAARLPAVLLSSDNITHDGGPSSLRSNLVYREVLLSKGYRLVTIHRQLWLIRNDRIARLSGLAPVIREVDDKPDSPLTALFQEPDLKSVPASWGRSYATLQQHAKAVLDVPPTMLAGRHDVVQESDGQFTITGPDPFVRFDISSAHLRGQDAGLLSFDFACVSAPQAVPRLRVFWTSLQASETASASFSMDGRPGRLVVPVDSSPAWLLSPQVTTIRFDVETDLQACARFSITNVRLLRRTASMVQAKPAQ